MDTFRREEGDVGAISSPAGSCAAGFGGLVLPGVVLYAVIPSVVYSAHVAAAPASGPAEGSRRCGVRRL